MNTDKNKKYEKWTEDEYQFLRDNVDKMTSKEIAKALNRTCSGVMTKLNENGIKRKNYNNWTPSEEKFIRENYSILTALEIGTAIGRSRQLVKNKIQRMGIRLPNADKDKRRENGQFKKGIPSWNKGLKGVHYSPESEFKKGHLPQTTKWDGCITIRNDHCQRNNKKYKWIRISLGKWELLHRFLWKQHYGNIPKEKILYFINNDTLDCRIENLMLVTRREQMRLNSKNLSRKMKEHTANGFTDKQIAGRLSINNPALRKELIKHPEVLELHRMNLKLQRELKNAIAK